MATPPSLKEVLSQQGLKKKDLESVCPRNVRNKVAVKLADWIMVGHCFNFSRSKLAAIDRESETEDQRRVALLDTWGEREGKGATYLKLAEVLHQRERGDLIEMLCDELRKSINPPGHRHALTTVTDAEDDIGSNPARVIDTAERIEALEKQFDGLHQQLMSEITENDTSSGMELLRALTMLPVSVRKEYESSIQQMLPTLDVKSTITELFLRLGPLFVFIDYGLLDHLISKFGSMKLQEDMKSYVSEVRAFMRETTVADLMDYWPGDEQPRLNYSKLRAKFSDDPKTYTLERLNNFRRKFCSKVRLSEFIFGLILLESGESFYATWLVPTIVAPELKKTINEIDEIFYQDEHVLVVSLDLEILYQSDKQHAEENLVSSIPKAKRLKLDIPSETYKEAHVSYHSQEEQIHRQPLHSLTEEKIVKLRAVVTEKDLEILKLKSKLETCSKDKEIMQELTSSMSEKISWLETLLQDKTELEEATKELQKMKTKLHDVTLKLGTTASHAMEGKELEVELERENMYCDNTSKPIMLELLEKQQRLKEWLLETSSIPPSVLPSDSGLATSIVDVSEGSEPPGDFEQQFLQDLTMKQEELVRKEEEIARLKLELDEAKSSEEVSVLPSDSGFSIVDISEDSKPPGDVEQQFLQDLTTKQEELVRKEEEIARLKLDLEKMPRKVAGQMENMQAAIPFDEKDIYRMDKNPHGICVIINNHKFYHPTDPDKAHLNRGGAEVDQKNLQLTFQYLRYKVEIYENLTHKQMTDVMMSMAQRDHTAYDSFICCILTHGEQNMVHGADSIAVSLLDLTGLMKMCTTLINKPKMFFIQAGRGDHEAKGHKVNVEEATQHDSTPSARTIPQNADFFFGYATPLRNVAYRSRRHGSWYISELCKTLTRNGYTSNLSNMMRKVNDGMCKAFTKEGYKQTAEFVDRLRKGVHFFRFSKVQQQQLTSPRPDNKTQEKNPKGLDPMPTTPTVTITMNSGVDTGKRSESILLNEERPQTEEVTTQQLSIANMGTQPGGYQQYLQNIRELEKKLRTKNEEVAGLAYKLQHFHAQMENMQAAIPFDEKDFYHMDKHPHGLCVIINNHQFYHPTDPDKAHLNRGGAEVEQKNLQLTFQYLRYKVEVYENLTHEQMTKIMMSMAQRDHTAYDSFICCILTHGKQNMVYGADSIPVSLLDLMGVMEMCTTLINKPKMFFIQCDRGDHEDIGQVLDVEESIQYYDSKNEELPSIHSIPQDADFFFGYSTPFGNAAYRNRRYGSWYISELCKVLTRQAYTSNLSNMMRKVNDNVCQAFTKEGYKQTAEFVDRLRKGVHFFHFSKVQQQQQL